MVVEVEGAGWCQSDNHIIEGVWTEYVEQTLPTTLAHENASMVVERLEHGEVEGRAVVVPP